MAGDNTKTFALEPDRKLLREEADFVPQTVRFLDDRRPRLKRLAQQMLGQSIQSKLDSSDIVQETLGKAHLAIDQFRGQTEAELWGWIRQILARQVAESIRAFRSTASRQVSRECSIDACESGRGHGIQLAADQSTPSHALRKKEAARLLVDCMGQLPDDYRQVIQLRSLIELDWPDVATRMERSVGAVRMLWVRALREIRPMVEERL